MHILMLFSFKSKIISIKKINANKVRREKVSCNMQHLGYYGYRKHELQNLVALKKIVSWS